MKVFVLGFAFLFSATMARGQSLVFHLLNADSGKPFRSENLTIEWNLSSKESMLSLGNDGTKRVTIPAGATTFMMLSRPKEGSERYRVAFIDCNGPISEISVERAVKEGVVPTNRCGKGTATTKPGEVIYWARPLPF